MAGVDVAAARTPAEKAALLMGGAVERTASPTPPTFSSRRGGRQVRRTAPAFGKHPSGESDQTRGTDTDLGPAEA